MRLSVSTLTTRSRLLFRSTSSNSAVRPLTTAAMRGCLAPDKRYVRCPKSSSMINNTRGFASNTADSSEPQGLGVFYHIEASNAEQKDATKLTVRGPDVDGILASMTVTLAVKGCSVVQLHAAMATDVSHDHSKVGDEAHQVEDTFYVVKRETGKPFADDELEDLALALLEATQLPMNVLSIKGAMHELEKLEVHLREHFPIPEQQITIIPSTEAK